MPCPSLKRKRKGGEDGDEVVTKRLNLHLHSFGGQPLMYAFGQQREKLLLQSMAKKNNVTFRFGFR